MNKTLFLTHFLLFVLLLNNLIISKIETKENITQVDQSIYEFFHDCTCKSFYLCPLETNISNFCMNPNYLCCKNVGTDQLSEDSKLELSHNCKCIPYYLCSAANNFMFENRNNFGAKELRCSHPDFICCKNFTKSDRSKNLNNDTLIIEQNNTIKLTLRNRNITSYSCGLAKTFIGVRILNPDDDSVDTIAGEFPWITEIFSKGLNNSYQFICGGSLIHPKVVLTATHSINLKSNNPENLKVIATGEEVFHLPGSNHENERNVEKIIKHEHYYSKGLYNDIALLILDKEYNFSNNMLNAICLPKNNENFDNRRCIAAGWGHNTENKVALRKVDMPVVDFERCQNLLRKTHLGARFNLHSSFMCAGGEEGKDTCKRDGGGPLMCFSENKIVQVGIVSWGISRKCGVVDQPGVYTNITRFRDWIINQLARNNITLN